MNCRLKKDVKTSIRKSSDLSKAVADKLGIQATSLSVAMHRNTIGLITLPVLKIISLETGVKVDDLVEDYAVDTAQAD